MTNILFMLRTRTFLFSILIPTLLSLIFFFGIWELIEHWMLNVRGSENVDILHILRGIFSIIFVALLFCYHWFRQARFENEMQSVCSLLNPATEGVLALDNSFEVVSMNARASQLLLNPLSVDLAPWLENLKDMLRTQEHPELFNPSCTARLRIVSLQAHARGLLLLLQDVTEEKRLEDQWLIAEKMASFGRMAAGLAHEIGTPLNIISGRAEMIEQAHSGKRTDCVGVDKHITAIEQQVERISLLIQQLLAHSGQNVPSSGLFSLNQLVDKVLTFLNSNIEHNKIIVRLSLEDNLPMLSGYADQIEQVLIHLFLNSIDAMHNRQGELEISTRDANGFLELEVKDNGSGISQENLTKIFDPFFTTKEFGSGTGLGLSVVASIVKSHGGRINVHSQPATGTIFTVRLPKVATPTQ